LVIFTWIISFFSWVTDAESAIFLATLCGSIRISRSSAISRSSMKSFGRFCCRYSMFTTMKVLPSVFSKSFESAMPGGVMSAASGFFRKVLSSCSWICSGVGRFVFLFLGM